MITAQEVQEAYETASALSDGGEWFEDGANAAWEYYAALYDEYAAQPNLSEGFMMEETDLDLTALDNVRRYEVNVTKDGVVSSLGMYERFSDAKTVTSCYSTGYVYDWMYSEVVYRTASEI